MIEKIYDEVKDALKKSTFSVEDVEELAELFSELAARTKEGNGESEG